MSARYQALSPRHRRQRGFTLIEVLVALGIVALALMTGLKATQALTHSAQRQSELLWAQLCADNALNSLRLSRQLPGMGDTSLECPQAHLSFRVQLSVRPTPNPSFRRVDAQVWLQASPILRVTTVLGRE
jgi:general secretion pathway protein I